MGYKPTCKDCIGENVGVITMEEDSKMLGEVVVKSSRPVTAIKGNALVTTVANTQLSHAGTANDVLRQVPMVTGRDGNFEVFGKGTPLIYINGRVVQDKNELVQLNSQDIKNVEVITNPGAKYDASVKSVIRIRTKPSQGEALGWNPSCPKWLPTLFFEHGASKLEIPHRRFGSIHQPELLWRKIL